MTCSQEYLEFVLDQLEGIGIVHSRRMFGGIGLYCDDIFFGLIADDVLHFKVDHESQRRYEAAGSKPFRPYGEESYSMSYWEVPASVLEDRDELRHWADAALAVAVRKLKNGTKTKKPARKKGDIPDFRVTCF